MPRREVCTTPECLRAASRLLDRMDRSVSPCQDFYQFACGNYLHENVVPDDALYRSAMQEMQEDVLVIIKSKCWPYSLQERCQAVGCFENRQVDVLRNTLHP